MLTSHHLLALGSGVRIHSTNIQPPNDYGYDSYVVLILVIRYSLF
jgi:hypothetical protein